MRKFVGGWEGQEKSCTTITLKRNEHPHHTHMNILQTTSYPALGIFPMPLHLRMSIYSWFIDLICDAHCVCSVNSGNNLLNTNIGTRNHTYIKCVVNREVVRFYIKMNYRVIANCI